MKYRVLMHIEIEAHDPRHALVQAKALHGKLREILRESLVRLTLASAGITLVEENGEPVTTLYNPEPAMNRQFPSVR